MKSRSIKNIFFVFASLAIMAFATGYFLWNKPHKNIMKTEAIETNAVTLYRTFITDSIKAKGAYVNNVLNVSGIIKNISVNQQNQQVVLLKTSDPDASVNCTMEANAEHIKAGDQVTLKGLCIGYISGDADMGLPGDVFLVRCYLST